MIYGLIIVVFLAICLLIPDVLILRNETLPTEIRDMAADRILTLHARIWPAVISLICILGLHSFRIFHRLIGPLYRFRWVFDKIRIGDLIYPVKIREKDYLHKEEKALNAMILTLLEKVEAIHTAGLDASKSLNVLQRAMENMDSSPGQKEALFRTHGRNIETLLKEVRFFRILRSDLPLKASESENHSPAADERT